MASQVCNLQHYLTSSFRNNNNISLSPDKPSSPLLVSCIMLLYRRQAEEKKKVNYISIQETRRGEEEGLSGDREIFILSASLLSLVYLLLLLVTFV